MSILLRPRAFNSFILVLFRAESFKCFATDEDSPSAISTPSSLNLLPRTIFVIAGSGVTPRGFGVEWSAYQRDTWDKVMIFFVFEIRTMRPEIFLTWEVTSLKNCRKAPVFNGKLSCGVLEIGCLLKNTSGSRPTCLSTSTTVLVLALRLARASDLASVQCHQV